MTGAYLVRQTRTGTPCVPRTRVIALKDMPKVQVQTVDRKSYGFIVPRLARTLVIALKAVPIDGAWASPLLLCIVNISLPSSSFTISRMICKDKIWKRSNYYIASLLQLWHDIESLLKMRILETSFLIDADSRRILQRSVTDVHCALLLPVIRFLKSFFCFVLFLFLFCFCFLFFIEK